MFALRFSSCRGAVGALTKVMHPQSFATNRLAMPHGVRAFTLFNPVKYKTHTQNDTMLLGQLQASINAGGGFNDENLKYRWALQTCEKHRVSEDEIEAALDDAVDSKTPDTHELVLHATGPGNVSFILACFTKDPERTKASIADIVKKFKGASMGEKSTTDMDDEDAERFYKHAHIIIDPKRRDGVDNSNMDQTDASFQQLIQLVHGGKLALESAEVDYGTSGRCLKIDVSGDNFFTLMGDLDKNGRIPEEATLEWGAVPHNTIFVMTLKIRSQLEKMKVALYEHDDVAQVCHNAEYGDDNKAF